MLAGGGNNQNEMPTGCGDFVELRMVLNHPSAALRHSWRLFGERHDRSSRVGIEAVSGRCKSNFMVHGFATSCSVVSYRKL